MTISDIAESLGITNHISESVYVDLAAKARDLILRVVADSILIKMTTKRTSLSASDRNSELEIS